MDTLLLALDADGEDELLLVKLLNELEEDSELVLLELDELLKLEAELVRLLELLLDDSCDWELVRLLELEL